MKRSLLLAPLLLVLALHALAPIGAADPSAPAPVPPPPAQAGGARNVILFIGDGMGPEQVKAGGLYLHGRAGSLSFEQLPHVATVVTDSATRGGPTDSAAAATAIATGRKVSNNVVALEIPGSGRPLTTLAEHFRADGRAVGIVTTDRLSGATPASFISHAAIRNMSEKISDQILTTARTDVMLGAAGDHLKPEDAAEIGYIVAADGTTLAASVDLALAENKPLAAFFRGERFPYRHYDDDPAKPIYGERLPTLPAMTEQALRVLEKRGGEKGFFVMIESALIDKSGHNNDIKPFGDDRIWCNVKETVALHEAVDVALAWAKGRADTLILVTADHETGGLEVREPRGRGETPKVKWSHTSHTRTPVGAYAAGPGSDAVTGQIENTELFHVMMRAAGLEATAAH